MRCDLLSIAALGFASIALAAPAAVEKRERGRGRWNGVKTTVVTQTVT